MGTLPPPRPLDLVTGENAVLRPEVGFCFNPGDEGHYTHFSLGLSVFLVSGRLGF